MTTNPPAVVASIPVFTTISGSTSFAKTVPLTTVVSRQDSNASSTAKQSGGPTTLMLTVALSLAVQIASSSIVYSKVSKPIKPTGGVYV